MQNKEKFNQIYQRYYRLMYQVAYGILQNHEDTQDALQESFFRIAQNISKISDPICPKTKNFCVIICRNVALDMWNVRKKRERNHTEWSNVEIEDENTGSSPEKAGEATELLEAVKEAIRALPERYRTCLYLSIVSEFAPKEIARILGVKEATVYKRIKRGKRMLQEKLRKMEIDTEGRV